MPLLLIAPLRTRMGAPQSVQSFGYVQSVSFGGNMNIKKTVMTATVCLVLGAVCFAAGSMMGTWKLNESKSKLAAGAAKNNTVVYTADGDKIKATIDGVDGDGKPMHTEWVGMMDGKDYAVTGDPASDMRSMKKIDDNTTEITVKKGGKVMATGKIVMAPDGKSRTVTVSGTDSMGMKMESTAVYEKQ